jgi:hypothetical protein
MKRIIVTILAVCLLGQPLLLGVRAQTSAAGAIDQIRASIVALERIERGGVATGEVAALNREFLTNKWKQLREALRRRETALQEYLLVAGASLSETEGQAVQASLGMVRRELRNLDTSIAGSASADGESDAAAGARDAESARVVSAGWARAAAAAPVPQDGGGKSGAGSRNATAFPPCSPDPRPDEKKDFIINARTGATRGKRGFGRTDTARIIVVEKNPFRYEYELTTKEQTIPEPAIGAFFGRFPLLAEELKEKTESGSVRESAVSCPTLNEVIMVESQLAAEDSSSDANSLRNGYLAQKRAYDQVAQRFKTAQDTLNNPHAVCPGLRDTAEGIRSTLQGYEPDLKSLSERAKRFQIRAEFLQSEMVRLQGSGLSPACTTRLDQLRRLAVAYVSTAATFQKGIESITEGKGAFDAAVERINAVLSDDNAFSEVREQGPFSLPTNVEITLKRKDRLDAKASFAQIGNTATVNFGGGARFAIAGGVVASPFETVTYKRVPAIIGGRATTIIGEENSSNSRILPILMLHGRLFEMPHNRYFSGVHLSLGVTAKPNDEGTNVEWLVGPSLSFVEERLFLTFGGYAGRRQQLQGNLAPGQELPEEFKDDIPINNRLTWKPGFALTYKFK